MTTNLVNQKMYIGVDSKNNPKYLGSGRLLKEEIEIFGIENFQKTSLKEFLVLKDAYAYERILIKELDAANSDQYYNIHVGGKGGFEHINNKGENNPMYRKSVFDAMIKKYGEELANIKYDEYRKKISKSSSDFWKGKPKSESHKLALSESKINFYKNLSDEDKIQRRLNISKYMKDANIVRSDEYKQKMSESIKSKSKQIHRLEICKYCKKEMNIANLKRWHGEKCKHKPEP
jgi:hypothetical protein